MSETFVQIYRRLVQYCGVLPPTQARTWVQDRFAEILDRRGGDGIWSFQYGFGAWVVQPPLATVANVIYGNNILTFPNNDLPGDDTSIVGFQLQLNGQAPYYTITSNPTTDTLTTVEACLESTGDNLTAMIVQAYFQSEQSDFEKMISLVDRQNNWQFRRNVSQAELNNVDPQRSTVSPPMWLCVLGFNGAYLAALPAGITDYYGQTNTSRPQPWFEAWPQTPVAQPYPYLYKKNIGELVNDGDPLPGFLRGSVLREGALADLCMWPGPSDTIKNPSYNPVNSNIHRKRFEESLFDMVCRDEQVAQSMYKTLAGYTQFPLPPYQSARFYQNHAPTGLVSGDAF